MPRVGFVAGVLRCVVNVTSPRALVSPPLLLLARCPGGLELGLLSLPWHAVVLLSALARCLLAGLAFTQLTTRRHAVRLLLRLALQSATLSTFQQILTACGGTAIAGASCPAPPPGAAPSVPAITAVTLAWAYAVRVNPSTIAVRCHLRFLLTMSAAVRLRSVAERLCFALRFRASFQSTPPSRSSPYAGLLTPPFPLPPPP